MQREHDRLLLEARNSGVTMGCEINGTSLEFGFKSAIDLKLVLLGAYAESNVTPAPMSYEITFPDSTPVVYYETWLDLASEWVGSMGTPVRVSDDRPTIRFNFRNVAAMAVFASEVEAGTMKTIVCDELDTRGVHVPDVEIPH